MKRLRILWRILKITGFNTFVSSFVAYLFISALGLTLIEPHIKTFADGLWFAFITATTVGYGDILATTLLGRLICVTLTLFGLIFFGCLSGVIVNYYTELTKKS